MISYIESKQIALSIIISGFIWAILFDNDLFLEDLATRSIIDLIVVISGVFLSIQSLYIFIKDGNMDRLKSFGVFTKEFLLNYFPV